MIIKIKTGRPRLFNILFIYIFQLMLLAYIYEIIINTNLKYDTVTTIYIIFLLIVVIFSMLANLIDLKRMPYKCIIYPLEKKINIKYYNGKNLVLSIMDIDYYKTTIVYLKATNRNGILLYTKDNRKILLSNYNLRDISPIIEFMSQNDIKCEGEESFSFYKCYLEKK